ncbi:uncharacterized protein BXZ73DRAFT_109833 [Epithele typhae]|uniref:uncharacterized protein n=1 Tax=Epithele typhae TaxID=378194 RepID=UPI0020072299|nr:uncharacterized protein BXZ73DRAFT_109833 [Epithele typhae]KAH9908817.1 hypothetical protein BXZ73DRAFT_109833 [Epithele typhae]
MAGRSCTGEILKLPDVRQAMDPSIEAFKTFDVAVSNLTVKKITQLLRDYLLPAYPKKKAELLNRLREFAAHPEQWAAKLLQSVSGKSARGNISKKRAAKSGIDKMIKGTFGESAKETHKFNPRTIPTARDLQSPPALAPAVIRNNNSWSEDDIPHEHLRFFTLDTGETFPFDKRTVRNPASISYARNLSALFKDWHESSHLVVNGRAIPIKSWPFFFQSLVGVRKGWKVLKQKWGMWKFIVAERESFPDDDTFWAAHSDPDGTRHPQQRIANDLQVRRLAQQADHSALVEQALKFYGGNLARADAGVEKKAPREARYFTYVRRNEVVTLKTPSRIASAWLQLLTDRPDVAAEWAAMREWEEIEAELAAAQEVEDEEDDEDGNEDDEDGAVSASGPLNLASDLVGVTAATTDFNFDFDFDFDFSFDFCNFNITNSFAEGTSDPSGSDLAGVKAVESETDFDMDSFFAAAM